MNANRKSIAWNALILFLAGVSLSETNIAKANAPAEKPLALALPGLANDDLATAIRAGIVNRLPKDMEVEVNDNWGHQAQILSVQGVRLIHVMRNHGNWEKAHVNAHDLPKQLSLRLGELGELQSLGDDRIAFTIHLTTPAQVELRKEVWQNGVRVHTRQVRARFQLSAGVCVEACRDDIKKSKLDHEVSCQVVRATYTCSKFLVEDINGIGGDLARLGNGLEKTFKPWQQAALLEVQKSVNSAVLAAAASRDVQVGLRRLILEASVARTAILRTQPGVATNSAVPAVALVPVQFPTLPFSMSLEFVVPIRVERPAPRMWAPTENAAAVEHALADHSIHYERTSHASSAAPASSHREPGHKKK